MKGYTYFVCYGYEHGFGQVKITRTKEIISFDDVLSLQSLIEKMNNCGGVVILKKPNI